MSASYNNRELSWLEFNQRVLNEAHRADLPLMERAKFLAITASNMDEFFQVRVGSLIMLRRTGSRAKDFSGLTPNQQLNAIIDRVRLMVAEQYDLWNHKLIPELAKHSISPICPEALSQQQRDEVSSYFKRQIFPLLTPIEIDLDHLEINIPSLQIVIICQLTSKDSESPRYVLIAVPPSISRLYFFPDQEKTNFTFIEHVIALHLHELFPNEEIANYSVFRVTRNGDIAVQEEDAIDLAGEMEEVLQARRFSDTVRLEAPNDCPDH